MPQEADLDEVADRLRLGIGLVVRRLRTLHVAGDLTLPESAALARLERGGPATASDLARQEQISPQSIGATLAALEARGYLRREADPTDGRRVVLSPTDAGLTALRDRRNARTQRIAAALASGFTVEELMVLRAAAPLLERLAEAL
jgi:DNA-binding MarR family transcriptional regulator